MSFVFNKCISSLVGPPALGLMGLFVSTPFAQADVLGPGITGYYVGASVSLYRAKTTPNLGKGLLSTFNAEHLSKDFKENLCGVTLTAGYMYSVLKTFAFAGQVYFGVDGKKVELHDSWILKRDQDEFSVRSNLDLRGRYRFGWELLGGMKLSSCLVYGLVGFQVRMMQTRGNLTLRPSDGHDEKAILFFGKDATTIENIEFAKLQPAHKVVFSPTVGFGARFYFLANRFFVGAEGRYTTRKRTLKAKYAYYNSFSPAAHMGSRSTSTRERTDRLEPEFKMRGWSASLTLGMRM